MEETESAVDGIVMKLKYEVKKDYYTVGDEDVPTIEIVPIEINWMNEEEEYEGERESAMSFVTFVESHAGSVWGNRLGKFYPWFHFPSASSSFLVLPPCLPRSSAISVFFNWMETSSGVSPISSFAFTSAPASISSSTISL